jgi:hypothetical protein
MEIIDFERKENMVQAFGIFRHVSSSDIHFTFRANLPDTVCITNTATVRALRSLGVPFKWLTEHLPPAS